MIQRAVYKIDPDTDTPIKIYQSVNEAVRAHNGDTGIWRVLTGKRPTAQGYKWEYVSTLNLQSHDGLEV
jgi:hypothetical protein